MKFNGPCFDQRLDGDRLERQHEKIRDLMLDGSWRTLDEIARLTGYPPASISAQLRHLRKDRFGAFNVDKRRRGIGMSGCYEYSVSKPAPAQMSLPGV